MIKLQTNPILIESVKEKDMKSILDWFDSKRDIFYKFAWNYNKDPKVIEDLFYNSIMNIYDGNRKLKKNTNFEAWVISIFLKECWEIQKNNQEEPFVTDNVILNDLSQLESKYKDTIILSYFMDLPHDQVAHILQVPIQAVKTNLLTGIQLLSKDFGNTTQQEDCKEFQNQFFDYLNWSLVREKKIDLEIHIHTCQSCQRVLGSVQNVVLTLREVGNLEIPNGFMKHITSKVNETLTRRLLVKKKRTIKSIVLSSLLGIILVVGFFTNGFGYLYYSWLDFRQLEDEQMLGYLKSGLGEPLNLEEESNGIKVKIKTAIADEYQTLIYFEIEDTNEESNKYMINVFDGVYIENERDILDDRSFPFFNFPIEKIGQEKNENIFSGKFSLLPISQESGTIKLKLTNLLKVTEDSSSPEELIYRNYNEREVVVGDWSFDIPVTKHASVEQELNKQIEIDGVPITFKKIYFAPTTTVLEYDFERMQGQKHINEIRIQSLENEGKISKAHLYGYHYSRNGFYQSSFDSHYFEKPKEIKVQFSSILSFIEDRVTFDLNKESTSPQTIEYLGNTISINNIIDGERKRVEFIDAQVEGREYESLHFEFKTENDEPLNMNYHSSDGVLIDRNGKTYDQTEYNYFMSNTEPPRYFQTKIDVELFEQGSNEGVFPDKLQIHGYSTINYIDDVVEISLD
ncbi:DUF4179 domain-containing protein [Bacillus luteolus]|uniref:DUF4179 domain-containing protein n=1 Tax=Litchfieldia luteola TaxID=682179 RepID=A0ABR9QJ16_9BACI|nr:DUF4179 domain-containing protein [Cytobacillus luteolus]MBE4908495.1 DUF4179 domain-containing protein [Cytobacillus luteolus]MBP1941347.1 DNA-directed RNA polymerase specialized sigma24 family protein [Cytobacillus luteolus]